MILQVFQKLQEEGGTRRSQEFDQPPLYFWGWTGSCYKASFARDANRNAFDGKVADYLFQTEEWTMYELILFGNLYSFYEVDYVTAWEEKWWARGFLQRSDAIELVLILATIVTNIDGTNSF